MSVKTVIEGSLLADCERLGQIRFGMFRVAEEITKRLLLYDDLDLYFANTRQTVQYDSLLRAFLSKLPSRKKINILSYPFAGVDVSLLERIAAKGVRRYYPGTFPGINRFDVFHSFYPPFSENIQKSNTTKSITLLDIIPLRMDGYEDLAGQIQSIVESVVPNFAIAISEFSRQDICDYDKRITSDRVFVVPLAADKSLFYPNKDKEEWVSVKSKYGLPDNYFLSLSGIDKRKNLQHLIYSFNKLVLQEKVGDLHLVMTGNLSFENSVFQQLNIDKETKKRIVFARPIEEADLSIVYSNALCFFFMSVYEGFGLPALEAMQCGTPVITSNATSLPEVVGEAGIMLPPTDQEALCSAMLQVYNDQQLRSHLSVLGLERAKGFSWERCSAEYAAIFKKIGNC